MSYFYISSFIFFKQSKIINHAILIPISSLLTVTILYLFNQTDFNSLEICERILSYGVTENVCNDGILSWPTSNITDSFKYVLSMANHLSFIYLFFMLLLAHMPFILFYLFEDRIILNSLFWKFLPLVFMNFIALFFIATDWGRWINIHIILLGLTFIFLFKETELSDHFYKKPKKANLFTSLFMPLFLLMSMSVWNIRHCCRENYYLIELNGFLGSLLSFL